MIFFVSCIFILYLFTFFSNRDLGTFSKEQVATLKGVMSVSIVVYHLSCYTDGWLYMFSSWGAPIVSLFYFISGYGLMFSLEKKGSQYLKNFFRNRIFRGILLPFLLVWLMNRLLFKEYYSLDLFKEFVNLIAEGRTTLKFSWYIFSILFFYIMFYITARYKNVVLVSFVYTVLYIVVTYLMGYERCWYISALAFPFGMFFCRYEKRIHKQWHSAVKYYATVPLCMLLLMLCVISKSEYMFFIAYVLIPLIVVCVCAKLKLSNKYIQYIGNYSYEIYLCHGMCMMFFRGEYINISSDGWYILLVFISAFAVAFCVKEICTCITSRFVYLDIQRK